MAKIKSKLPRTKYTSVSLPMKLIFDVDRLIEEFGYWPSRGAFVREACIKKIREERRLMEDARGMEATEKNRSIAPIKNRAR